MQVSIVIPTFNKLPLLLMTLDGLERQDADPRDFEVIVADDASTDGTSRALRRLERPYSLKIIRHETNRGRAAARNSAIGEAGGWIVVFLDDDMQVSQGFVRAHLNAHAGGGRIAAVGNVRTHMRANGSAVSRYLDTRGAQKIRGSGELPFRYFSTNNSSVRKEDLLAVGCFDESFRTYGFEDVEMAARLAKEQGVRFLFCAEAVSLHLHKHTLEDMLQKKMLAGRFSLPLLLCKHPELWSQVGLDIVGPLRILSESPARSASKIVFRALDATGFCSIAERIVRDTILYPLTNVLLDWLVLRSYWIGMGRPRRIADLHSRR